MLWWCISFIRKDFDCFLYDLPKTAIKTRSWDSAVGIATGWTAGVRSPAVQDFSLLHSFQRLGPNQLPVQWVRGALSPGVEWRGRGAYHSPLSKAEIKNGRAILSQGQLYLYLYDTEVSKLYTWKIVKLQLRYGCISVYVEHWLTNTAMFCTRSSSEIGNHRDEEICQTDPCGRMHYAQIMLDVAHCMVYVQNA
jgi:hypothetical protein